MAENLSLKISMLGKQLNNVTEEIMSMKSSLHNIERNIEIEVKNGGGIPVTMKTNELLKNLYEQTREGGVIDEKFKLCSENHSIDKKLGIFDKKSATWFNIVYRVIITVSIAFMLFKMIEFDKLFPVINNLSK